MSKTALTETEKSRRCSLLRLQKEYLEKAVSKLDESIELSSQIESIDDVEIIKTYLLKLKMIDAEIDHFYTVACDIEKSIQ
jgi:hypothetical protein